MATHFIVESPSGGLIACFETEGEAGICASQHLNSVVIEVEGEMPKKHTVEDARQVIRELKEDTPENRKRRQLFDEWAANNPSWQSIKEKFSNKE